MNNRFYVKRPTGKVFGPFDRNAIQMMLKTQKLNADAEISADKQDWQPITSVPEFAQAAGGAHNSPKATMMGGWQSGGDQPAVGGPPDLPARKGPPDLPAPKGGPPDLPARKPGLPDLPAPKGGPGLPTPKGAPDLPTPKGGAPDLPTPRGTDLPRPKAGLPIPKANADLPTSKFDPNDDVADLPTQMHADLPLPRATGQQPAAAASFDDDLFGGGSAAPADDDDLFGSAGQDDDDDLFGPAPGAGADDDDDLFGPPAGASAAAPPPDDDIFDHRPIADQVANDDDLFGQKSSAEDLFDAGGGDDDDDLFGAPSAGGDDDLFGSASVSDAPKKQPGDFLGGDQGFSFLDDQPSAPAGDEWGDDLFDDPMGGSPSAASAASEPFDDWGDDLLGEAPPPKARAPRASEESVVDANDPFRPASAGLRQEEPVEKKAAPRAATVADDRKRGGAVQLVVIAVAAVALLGVGYMAYSAFTEDDGQPRKTTKNKVVDKVSMDMIKSDNFADYAPLSDAASKPKKGEEGLWLLAQSMYLARFEDGKAIKRAAPVAKSLDAAKGGLDAVGRGAYEARSGNADAARAYLEGAASEDGDVGFFANLVMGIGDVKAVEAELARAAAVPIEQVPPEQQGIVDEPPAEDKPEDAAPAEGGDDKATGEDAQGEKAPDADDAPADEDSQPAAQDKPAKPAAKPDVTPDAAPAHANLQGLDERARAALKRASEMDPESHLPHYWLGRMESALGNTEKAIEVLTKALELGSTHVGTHVQLGAAHYAHGALNSAIDLLEKVPGELVKLAGPQERAEALHYAGLVHVARRDSDLAVESFTKALSIDATRGETLRALAEEYERAQKYKEALRFFTTNDKLAKNDPNVMLGIVRSHIGLEEWQHAIGTLEEGQRSFPDDAQFPYYLGQLFMKRGAYADAQKPLERAVEINPNLLSAHGALAQLAWRTDKDFERGEEHIKEIVARPAGIDANVATQVAEYYSLSGRRDTAEQWYRAALKRDRNNWPARLALSKLLLEDGKQDQARELLERARQEGVQDVRLSAYLADAYRQAQDYDRAIDEINQVIEAFPKSEDYIFIRGRIHFDRGNYDTAQKDFSRAFDLNPQFYDAYFYVGRTAFERGDFQNALKIFRHVLDYKPDRGNYRFYMARTFEALGRASEALDEFRKATAVDPAFGIENPMVYVHRGRLLSKLNYSREGKADIARALELAPKSVEARLAMAGSEYRDHNYQEAIKHYKTALDIDPIQPDAQANLGLAYLFKDRRAEAAKHLQLAVKYGNDDPEIFKRLGYVYRDMGQPAQAKEAWAQFLRKAQDRGDVPRKTVEEIAIQLEKL